MKVTPGKHSKYVKKKSFNHQKQFSAKMAQTHDSLFFSQLPTCGLYSVASLPMNVWAVLVVALVLLVADPSKAF